MDACRGGVALGVAVSLGTTLAAGAFSFRRDGPRDAWTVAGAAALMAAVGARGGVWSGAAAWREIEPMEALRTE